MHRLPLVTLAFASAALAQFDTSVAPLLKNTCTPCHNEKLSSGNLNIALFTDPASLTARREGWEHILDKLRSGEMPPRGIPKPSPEKVSALVNFVQGEFDRADKSTKPDPGRVTAHRLNRAEYTNTVRDLLGVDFRASEEFPADDSSYGFDNIGDVLTVSPTLMQKYLQAAEQIASRAVGGDPMPKPGVFNKKSRLRRIDMGTVEFKDRIDFDAEYDVRVLLTGHRGDKGSPVTMVISIDGKPIKTSDVPTALTLVNKQGGATQRHTESQRVFIPEGMHTFRAQFINDAAAKDIPVAARYNVARNIFADTMEISGPFPATGANASRKKILICDVDSGTPCVNRILAAFAHRAYRRPASKAEVDELQAVCTGAKTAGYTPKQSLQFAVVSALVSPKFLFRVERDPKPGAVARISDLELASRLSYFLWSSMPDDELLRLAESSRLHQPAVLDAQVKRLIADERSYAFAENFAGQWLEVRSLDAVKPDEKKFPEWSAELKDAMRTETTLFFQAILRDNRPLSDFIDGKYTYLNEMLAKHYGIEGVTGSEFRRVDLATDQRSGVFTQGSVLTVSSYPVRTSVVLRGKYLLENVLGSPPPPPPPDIPRLNEDSVGVAKSLRQQMEQHRSDPVCASCHSKMDVLGFGLENYDAIGRWRTADGKFPVDSSGSFPNGKSFKTPSEMKALLHDNMPEFTRTLTEKLMIYALGRGIEAYDRRTVRQIVGDTASQDYKFQTLVLDIVHSVPFTERRGPAVTEAKVKQEIASR